MMRNNRIFLSAPHMGEEELAYIQEAFASNWIGPLGPNVDAFERELSAAVGVEHAAAVSSGTAAIHLALELLGVGAGDVVFCSTLTFVASANPILYQGATPVFIDSEPDTWNMSPAALEEAFSIAHKEGIRPKAVIVVNLYGQSADLDAIRSLCDHYGVPIVEDAAESLGATYKGKASGTLGDFGVYSFNGNKIITASSGGMLVSRDGDAIQRARFLATQAREQAAHYEHRVKGYNYRMSNILAGIGRGQLKLLGDRVEARRQVFSRYEQALADVEGVSLMPEAAFGRSNRWLTALTVDAATTGVDRDTVLKQLAEANIEARPVWKPLHLQPLFKGCRYYSHQPERNVAEALFASGLCLPSGSNMTEEDQAYVIDVLLRLFRRKS